MVRVVSMDPGSGMESRLAGLGVRKGIDVRVVRNDNHGPLVLSVNNSRVMVGRGMAASIVVEEV
ncbi:hypothetical protein BVX97_00835 [bacterium E08(2017)]|nr:hypothetical protein BVX97_00835 [bacterium E08(2017)]